MTPAVPQNEWPGALRRYAWDILPCDIVNSFLPALTLHPSSEEGVEVEHKASHERRKLAWDLSALIECHAAFAARVLSAFALRLDKNTAPDQAILQQVTLQYGENVQYGAYAVIANLLAEGYLQPGPKAGPEMFANWVAYQEKVSA